MKPLKISLAAMLALIFAGHVHLHSVEVYPGRVTAMVGEEVQINCEVEFGRNLEMTWDFNKAFVYIYTRGKEFYPLSTSKYAMHKTGMNFALIVRDLNLEDGGEYMCTSYKSEATAHLVVLDMPSITLNPPAPLESETAMVTCEAKFGGPKKDRFLPDHYPYLKMYLKDISPNEMVTANDTSDFKKYFSISMTKNFTAHSGMNKRHIKCEIGTAEPLLNTSVVATMHVLYSVRDINITPNEEKYKVGDTISCIADSNPAAGYEWKNVQGGNTIYGNLLKITDDMNGENNWECVARNVINGVLFDERMQIHFVADDPSKSGNEGSPVTIPVVTVLTIIVIVIIAAVALIFTKKILKKYQKGSRTYVNANNLRELEAVEAEKLLVTNHQELVPLEAEHLANNLPQLKSVEDKKLLANNHQELVPLEAEHLANNLPQLKSVEAEKLLATNFQELVPLEAEHSATNPHELVPLKTEHSANNLPQLKSVEAEKLLANNLPQLKSVEAEKLLANNPQELVPLESEHLANNLPKLKSVEAKKLLANNHQELVPLEAEHLANNLPKLKSVEAEKLLVVPHGGEDSSLKDMLTVLMSGEENFKKLYKDQKKLMSVIQKISSHGDVQYRTECLNFISFSQTFSSGIKYIFEWSEEYLSTLKDLLENGADPTWISPWMWEKARKKRTTAQNAFFYDIFVNLWEKNELHESLLQVLPLMLSKKCKDNELLKGNLLREFVGYRWGYIATNRGSRPPNFFRQFKNILREILKQDGTLLVQKDWNKRTPLQYFLINIKLEESIFSEVREIIQMLQTPEVLSSQDVIGWTALHYLAYYFPVIRGEVTQSGRESFLELVKNFASQSNVCHQDKDGKTALHLLVLNPNKSELFLDVVKIFRTASNIKSAKGQTPLQILLEQYPSKVSESSVPTFLDTVKFLNTHTNANLQDREGTTALHTIAAQFGRNLPLYRLNVYCELFQMFASETNVSFQDERGQTALHILACKFPSEISSEQSGEVYQNVMKHLASYNILEKTDCNGLTALQILAGKFTFEISTHVMETFLEVIKRLAVPSNICIQDPQGLTAFKIISQRCCNEVPEHYKEKFQEISDILSENN